MQVTSQTKSKPKRQSITGWKNRLNQSPVLIFELISTTKGLAKFNIIDIANLFSNPTKKLNKNFFTFSLH